MSEFRCFTRHTWQVDPTWPDGYKPLATCSDDCRTVATFDDRQDAIDFCGEHNHKWRKHSDRIHNKTASPTQKKVYYSTSRYEFTEA